MNSIDTAAIEEAMRMAALDNLKGYARDHYGVVKQVKDTEYVDENNAGGYQVLTEPAWNKGKIFENIQYRMPEVGLESGRND